MIEYSIKEMINIFTKWRRSMPVRIELSLAEAAALVKKEAESYIGTKQTEWDALEDSTKLLKSRMGLPVNSPLLRTGNMQKSIKMKVMPWESVVYSTNEAMWYHEEGTKFMSHRGVLSLALYRNELELRKILGPRFCLMFYKTSPGI